MKMGQTLLFDITANVIGLGTPLGLNYLAVKLCYADFCLKFNYIKCDDIRVRLITLL